MVEWRDLTRTKALIEVGGVTQNLDTIRARAHLTLGEKGHQDHGELRASRASREVVA